MKIGILAWDLNISGGTQRQALELASHLENMGHDIKVYTAYYNKEKCYPYLLDRLDVKYLFPDGKDEFSRLSNSILRNIFIWVFPFGRSLLRAMYAEKIYNWLRDIIDIDIDLLCCHDYKVYAVGAKYKIKTGIPVVWQMNDLPGYLNKSYVRNIRSLISIIIINKSKHIRYIKTLDEIVVMDYLNKNKLKNVLGLESIIVRNGLSLEKFKFSKRECPSNKFKIMANGIFYPWRRFEDLILALKIVKSKGISFELNHIGTDIRCKWYAEKIYKMVKELNFFSNVKFHGHVSEEKLIEFYSSSDIFVFPNSPQTWGLAVFEAMGCGTPVVLSKGCGASEVLTNEENCILVSPASPEEIANAIIRLKENPELWRKLSINGRKFVEENIRWDLYANGMVDVFNKILENQPAKK